MLLKFVRGTLIVVLLTGIVALLVGWLISLPKLDASKLQPNTVPTLIYDRNGQVAFRIDPGQGSSVTISDIPINIQHAFIATEDSRFYENQGIDVKGMLRSLVYDVTHGARDQGASTITQQLAKMVYLTDNKKLSYKLEQIALAAQIERQFTKDQILDMYLNRVYLGVNATGVEQASKTFFGKSLNSLSANTPQNLADAALFASMPRSPAYYDPFANPDHALSRRNLVLSLMVKNGYITDQQAKAAQKMPLGVVKGQSDSNTDGTKNPYPWYLDAILEEADGLKSSSINAEAIMRGGLKIYTSLNPSLQTAMQHAYTNSSLFPDQQVESAAVFTDPHTGGIEALVGGRNHVYRGFNRALDAQRSPGSSIKPIMDYGPALDIGKFGPDSLLVDRPISFGNYQPHDWDYNFWYHSPGQVTMTEALRESWNIPAVWTLDQIGVQTGIAYARKDGLTIPNDDANLSIAIGGMSHGVSPKDMAQAYQAFDNGGQMVPAHLIDKVTNSNGDVLYQHEGAPVQVFKASTAATMTQMLTRVVQQGTGTTAAVANHDVAGKTGTSEFSGSRTGDTDAWFVGYTPSLVGAVWLGYDHTDNQHYLKENGAWHPSAIPGSLFAKIVSDGLSGQPSEHFQASSVQQPTAPPVDTNKPKKDKSSNNQEQPPSISDLKAVEANGSVSLTWTPISAQGVIYSVFRADSASSTSSSRIGVVHDGAFIDSSVSSGQTYYYIVVATDGSGQQLCQSNMVAVTIGDSSGNPGSSDGTTPPSDQSPPDRGQSSGQKPGKHSSSSKGGLGDSGDTGIQVTMPSSQ